MLSGATAPANNRAHPAPANAPPSSWRSNRRSSPTHNQGAGETIAQILSTSYPAHSANQRASRFIIAAAGSLAPQRISATHTLEIDEAIAEGPSRHGPRYTMASALRHILRWLLEVYNASQLDWHIRPCMDVRPRKVTATHARSCASGQGASAAPVCSAGQGHSPRSSARGGSAALTRHSFIPLWREP